MLPARVDHVSVAKALAKVSHENTDLHTKDLIKNRNIISKHSVMTKTISYRVAVCSDASSRRNARAFLSCLSSKRIRYDRRLPCGLLLCTCTIDFHDDSFTAGAADKCVFCHTQHHACTFSLFLTVTLLSL